jgi:hypothetical protein
MRRRAAIDWRRSSLGCRFALSALRAEGAAMARHSISVTCLLLCACGAPAAPQVDRTPSSIAPPERGQRVVHPAGYSIVFPPGLQPEVDPEGLVSSSITKDALGTMQARTPQGGEKPGSPQLLVRRYSDEAVKAGCVPAFYKPTQFQGRPAFAHFDAGYGPGSDRAQKNTTWGTKGGYSPTLDQELIFERGGAWFQLSFNMGNLKEGEPVHKGALEMVQQYFDTFEYQPVAGK